MLTATKDGITLSSTTASQEVLDKAVGVTPEEKKLEQSAAAGASAAQAETASTSEADNPQESEEVRKHKGGWQRRIDKLTKDKSTLEETLNEERLARQRLEAQLAGKPAGTVEKPNVAAAGAEDVEPDEVKVNPKTGKPWTSWKEFNAEHTRWVLRQEKLAETAKASQTADQTELQKNLEAHRDRLTAAKAKYPDWDDVSETLNKEATVPEGVAMTLVELDNGPDVIYHLAKNPDLLKEIRGLSELKAITRIGVIADKLASEAKTAADAAAKAAAADKGAKPNSSPEKKTVNSSSPDPITPVGGGSSATTVDRSKMSTTDWIKQRNAGTIK